jgi:hypothetical protein
MAKKPSRKPEDWIRGLEEYGFLVTVLKHGDQYFRLDKPRAADSQYLTVKEAQAYASIRRTKCYKLMDQNIFKAHKRSNRVYIERASIDRWLNSKPPRKVARRGKK